MYPKKINELPEVPYYAILTPQSTFVEGDERSRTNPGHGYHAHTVENWSIEVFDCCNKWKEEIIRLTKSNDRKFQAVKMFPAQVQINVEVEVVHFP